MEFIQKSFSGGIDTVSPEAQIPEDAYIWMINGRNRFSYTEPVSKHVLQTTPEGNKQGCIAVGNVLVIFVAGKAYYRKYGDTAWVQFGNFQMNPYARKFWTQAVPASFFNFVRKTDGANIHAQTLISTDFKVSGTPACIVVQDGINQPWLIIYDWTNQIIYARESKKYDDWSNVSEIADDREYVPIGKQMMYLNGKLFVVSLDGRSIYHSVTGRPLDFMVNVDSNGNKMPSEYDGGASSVSFALDYNEITCIKALNIPDTFLYGTMSEVRLVTLDYNDTLFSEPKVREAAKIRAGVVNQDSFVELLGDYAFIDQEGVVSFDAVQTIKFNGKNSIFSLQISKLTDTLTQVNPYAFLYDNYAFFNLYTKWGNLIAVYDTQKLKWASLDITEVQSLKEVCVVETVGARYLYGITEDDKLWQLYADPDNVYLCQVKTRQHLEEESVTEHKTERFRTVFDSALTEGTARVTEYVDNRIGQDITQPLYAGRAGVRYPVKPPVFPSNTSQVDNPAYTMNQGLTGKKIGFIISWNVKAKLLEYQFISKSRKADMSQKQSHKTLL